MKSFTVLVLIAAHSVLALPNRRELNETDILPFPNNTTAPTNATTPVKRGDHVGVNYDGVDLTVPSPQRDVGPSMVGTGMSNGTCPFNASTPADGTPIGGVRPHNCMGVGLPFNVSSPANSTGSAYRTGVDLPFNVSSPANSTDSAYHLGIDTSVLPVNMSGTPAGTVMNTTGANPMGESVLFELVDLPISLPTGGANGTNGTAPGNSSTPAPPMPVPRNFNEGVNFDLPEVPEGSQQSNNSSNSRRGVHEGVNLETPNALGDKPMNEGADLDYPGAISDN